MILIYSDRITARQQYIFDLIFRDILRTHCSLTDNPEEYAAHEGPGMAYSREDPGRGVHFIPEGLLHETGLRSGLPAIGLHEGIPSAFQVEGGSALPFDPFSFAFFLVTRYEEYLPFPADMHGRFPSSASLACRYGFIEKPILNILARRIREAISGEWPGFDWPALKWDFQPTFDIDIAFAHLAKGKARALAAMLKLLLKGDIKQQKERIATLSGRLRDPYDNFAFQEEVMAGTGLQPVYFFLLGDFGRYDRNNDPDHQRMRELVARIAKAHETGLHPSYRSFRDPEQLRKEFRRFAGLAGHHAEKSRQHFLRLEFPATYRALIEFGVRHDYSMGYSDINGFRAGTANPFRFYDLLEDQETPLVIHPFIFMDSAFMEQLKVSPGEAQESMKKLIGEVEKFGGTASGIWHNYALGGQGEFAGWEVVFRNVIAYAAQSSR